MAPLLWPLLALGCSGDKNQCPDQVRSLRGCAAFDGNACDTPAGRCLIACVDRAGCGMFARWRQDLDAPQLGRCLSACGESFTCQDDGREIESYWRCDGENDCVDGSDELDCQYFACASGELIGIERQCNEYAECVDRSDELDCPYFLCADDGAMLPRAQYCDGSENCEDGSDEEACP